MRDSGDPSARRRRSAPSSGSRSEGRGTRRAPTLPTELENLLSCRDSDAATTAWSAFLERYTRRLLHTVHSQSDAHDGAMDRYAFVLQRLRDDDFRRAHVNWMGVSLIGAGTGDTYQAVGAELRKLEWLLPPNQLPFIDQTTARLRLVGPGQNNDLIIEGQLIIVVNHEGEVAMNMRDFSVTCS